MCIHINDLIIKLKTGYFYLEKHFAYSVLTLKTANHLSFQ